MKSNRLFRIIKTSILTFLFFGIVFTIDSCKKEYYYLKIPKELLRMFPYQEGDTIKMFNDVDTMRYVLNLYDFSKYVQYNRYSYNKDIVKTEVLNVQFNIVGSNKGLTYELSNIDKNGDTFFTFIVSLPYQDTIADVAFRNSSLSVSYTDSILINNNYCDSIFIIPNEDTMDSLFLQAGVGIVKIKAFDKNYYFSDLN